MRRSSAALTLTAAVLLGLTGCGGSTDADISPQAAEVLGADVDAITAAARARDATKVQEALKTLRAHVDAQQASGDLSAERASRILAAGAKVALDVGVPAPKVVVSRVPAPPAPRPEGGKDDKKDDDKDDDDEKKEDGKRGERKGKDDD